MATANGNSNYYSLKDMLALKDPNGAPARVAEILEQANPMLADGPSYPTMLDTSEQVTVRKQLGSPKWTGYNEYASASVAKVDSVTELTGHIEDWSVVDKRLTDQHSDVNQFLMQESRPKMQAIAQEVAATFIYGNASSDPKSFTGFFPRLNKLNSNYESGSPVVLDAGGTTPGANGSILIVGWGQDTVHFIYPKATTGGVNFENLGEDVSEIQENGITKRLRVYRSYFSQDTGLAVRDYRYMVRIANIDMASLATIGTANDTSPKLYQLFRKALSRIPNPQLSNVMAYTNRDIWLALADQQAETGNANYQSNISERGFVQNVMGVPVRLQDCMLATEAVVSA